MKPSRSSKLPVCEISDEILMTYADGEIDDDLRRQVETYLANDPNGQQRLAAFALTGRKLSHIFDRPMREPVPAHLINFVRGVANDCAGTSRKSHPDVRYSNRQHRILEMSSRTWALAASVASLFAIGASSLFYFERKPDDVDIAYGLATSSDGSKIADKVLAAVLETAPSGNVVPRTIGGEQASIRPSFTFRAAKGEYCRQYEILPAKISGFSGVACREASGAWRVEIQTPFAERHAGDGMIIPAGKESLQSIDATVDRLISGDVPLLDDEARAMRGGWRGAKP